MNDIKVRVKALAYERSHPKTKLSQFENDSDYVDVQKLEEELRRLKEWVLENGGGSMAHAVPGGNLFAGEVGSTLPLRLRVDAGDIRLKNSTPVGRYFCGGDIRLRTKEST